MRAIITSQIDQLNSELNPLESIVNTIAFSSADFGAERDRAWLYGIVVGWEDADDDPDENPMPELAARHRWSDSEVARLRRLHASFNLLRASYVVPAGDPQ